MKREPHTNNNKKILFSIWIEMRYNYFSLFQNLFDPHHIIFLFLILFTLSNFNCFGSYCSSLLRTYFVHFAFSENRNSIQYNWRSGCAILLERMKREIKMVSISCQLNEKCWKMFRMRRGMRQIIYLKMEFHSVIQLGGVTALLVLWGSPKSWAIRIAGDASYTRPHQPNGNNNCRRF